jgi:hypothetical protein
MAETTKEQAKNSEIRKKNTAQTLESEKGITTEKQKQNDIDNDGVNITKSLEDIIKEKKKTLKENKKIAQESRDLADEENTILIETIKNSKLREKFMGGNNEAGRAAVSIQEKEATRAKEKADQQEIAVAQEEKRLEILEESGFIIQQSADNAKKIGDNIESFVKKFPGGDALTKALGIDDLGDFLQNKVMDSMVESIMEGGNATDALNVAKGKLKDKGKDVLKNAKGLSQTLFKLVRGMHPLAIMAAAAVGVFLAVRKIRQAARDLGETLQASTAQSMKLLVPLKAQERKFKTLGLDATKIKTTLGTIATEFGNLENVTASNAANVEMMAQNLGVAGTEIVKFNKVMTDLTGMTFDQATATAQVAANLAKQENVATGKVLSDISSNAADFARFSKDGAQGLAQAAVEAAKVGSSLSEIVKAADSLLNFEDSITKQFEAQVLTGKQINTERARQLALDGDIAGLTTEIQSIVGSVGDIQSLNVIQRKSVADAIGISVQDLLRISRGEAAQAQATVQDKLDVTNKLLAKQIGLSEEQIAAIERPVSMEPKII